MRVNPIWRIISSKFDSKLKTYSVSITIGHVCLMLYVFNPRGFNFLLKINLLKNSSKKLMRRCSKRNTRLWENRKRRFSWRLRERNRPTNAKRERNKNVDVLEGNYGLVVAGCCSSSAYWPTSLSHCEKKKYFFGQIFRHFNFVASFLPETDRL